MADFDEDAAFAADAAAADADEMAGFDDEPAAAAAAAPPAAASAGGDDGGDDAAEEPPAKKQKSEASGGASGSDAPEKKPDEEFVGVDKGDDEATLDEEEFEQGGAAGQKAENDALADEAEMPLEQLLAMYGLSKDQLGNSTRNPHFTRNPPPPVPYRDIF